MTFKKIKAWVVVAMIAPILCYISPELEHAPLYVSIMAGMILNVVMFAVCSLMYWVIKTIAE